MRILGCDGCNATYDIDKDNQGALIEICNGINESYCDECVYGQLSHNQYIDYSQHGETQFRRF